MASSLLSTLVVSLLLLASLTNQASTTTTRLVLVTSQQLLHISTISAAPAVLPASPESSPLFPFPPAMSPDVEPLLPSPGGSGGSDSPSESTLPIIPSSPSPPNPDDVTAPQPEVALAPSSSLPVSASWAEHRSLLFEEWGFGSCACLVFTVILCMMQLSIVF